MMDQTIMYAILLGICLLEASIGLAYVHAAVPDAITRSKKNILIQVVCILFISYILFANRPVLFFSDPIWLMEIGIFSLCILVCAKKQKLLLFEIVVLYSSIVVLLDFFFAFLSMGVLREQFWTIVYYRNFTGWSAGIYLCTRIICLAFLLWMRKKPYKGISISRFKKLLIPVCGLLCILVRFFRILLERVASGAYDMPGWGVGVALLTFLLLLLLLTIMMQRTGALQDENDILRIQDETQQMRYEELAKHGEENRQLLHDMKHHIMVLQGCCEADDMDSISEYLTKMGVMIQKNMQQKWTGHRVLDVVLNQKKKDAENAGILFEIDCKWFQNISLEKEDIVSLFGNLLDNAIEACRKIKEEKPYIHVSLKQQEQILYINIVNSIENAPVIKNNLILSSKRNNGYGYGLKSVKKIVEKYDGMLVIEADNHTFCVYITFYI